MSIKKCQWRTHNPPSWTTVHLYDTASPSLDYGYKKTICGKAFELDSAETAETSAEHLFRGCKTCKKKVEGVAW